MQRMYRTSNDKIFLGVAGGIARALNVDPVIIRVLFVVGLLVGGSGFLAYFVLAIVMPSDARFNHNQPWEPSMQTIHEHNQQQTTRRKTLSIIIGASLVLLGLVNLVEEYLPDVDLAFIFPATLVVAGAVLLFRAFMNDEKPYTENTFSPNSSQSTQP